MLRIYLACIFIGCAVAQNCPNVAVKPNFNMNKFLGIWYEVANEMPEKTGKCVVFKYTANPNGTYYFLLTQTPTHPNDFSSVEGVDIQFEEEKAKLTVKMTNDLFPESHFWILETDYESFAMGLYCIKGEHMAWLFTREREPAKSVLDKAYAAFDSRGMSRSKLKPINQKNCN